MGRLMKFLESQKVILMEEEAALKAFIEGTATPTVEPATEEQATEPAQIETIADTAATEVAAIAQAPEIK